MVRVGRGFVALRFCAIFVERFGDSCECCFVCSSPGLRLFDGFLRNVIVERLIIRVGLIDLPGMQVGYMYLGAREQRRVK